MWMQLTFGTVDGKARFLNVAFNTVLERNTIINPNHRRYEKTGSYNQLSNEERSNIANFINRIDAPIDVKKRGVYSMLSEDKDWATGHVDLIHNTTIADGSWHLGKHTKIINLWNF